MWAAVATLLALHWLMAVSATRTKSTLFDEIAHLTAGESYWLTGDIRLQPEGGILPQRWQALGLAGGGFRFPSLDQDAWWHSDAYAMGYHFFYDGGNVLAIGMLRGRAAAALLALPLGLLVFLWSRALFGTAGGFLSLGLFAFSPTMLAHTPAMNSDTAATLFFTAATWAACFRSVTVPRTVTDCPAVSCGGLVTASSTTTITWEVSASAQKLRLDMTSTTVAVPVTGCPRYAVAFAWISASGRATPVCPPAACSAAAVC